MAVKAATYFLIGAKAMGYLYLRALNVPNENRIDLSFDKVYWQSIQNKRRELQKWCKENVSGGFYSTIRSEHAWWAKSTIPQLSENHSYRADGVISFYFVHFNSALLFKMRE